MSDLRFYLVGDRGFEPLTSSVSRKQGRFAVSHEWAVFAGQTRYLTLTVMDSSGQYFPGYVRRFTPTLEPPTEHSQSLDAQQHEIHTRLPRRQKT